MSAFGFCLVVFALGLWRFQIGPISPIQHMNPIRPVGLMGQTLPFPQAELLAGILFGGQQDMDYQWTKKMNLAGVRHITAVSGSNIVLLSQILVWLGVTLGLYRQWAVGGAAFLLWLYVFLIGCPASAIRAGVMASLLLVAGGLGRQNRPERTIVLAGAVMLAINPWLLRFDIGFQLSFLAVLGLIYLTPLLQDWLALKFKFLQPANTARLLAINFSAWLFTLPLSIYYFGYFSPTSIIANLLITSIIPLIMILGFLLVISGLIWPPLSVVFAWPSSLLLSYLLQIVDWCSPTIFAGWQLHFSKLILIVCYFGLMLWIYRRRKNNQRLTPR